MSKLFLSIDRLILEGVPLSRAESALMGSALEAELGVLVAQGGLDHRTLASRLQHPLSVDPVALDHAAGPSVWGCQVARSLYGSLTAPLARPGIGGKRR